MSRIMKSISFGSAAILAAAFALALAPASSAQAQAQNQTPAAVAAPDSATAPAAQADASASTSQETLDRVQELEKQMSVLQREIAALKESESSTTAALKTAALTQPAAAAPAADDKITLGSLLGPVTFSGFVDAYYAFNFNQPNNPDNPLGNATAPNGIDGNALRFFDNNTNQFSLNAIEAVVDKAPDATVGGTGRAGYHIGLIYGQAAEAINGVPFSYAVPAGNPTDANNVALKEAYVDYIAPWGKGLTITVGKFVTPAGNEVIETNGNWNYSRSILFYYAIPYFHFGASAKYTFNPQWSVTGYLVNGWNNTQTFQTGKTYGVSLAWTPNKYWAVTENYLAGAYPETFTAKPNAEMRQLSDTVISWSPNATWNFALNGDYANEAKCTNGFGSITTMSCSWYGAAGYVKYALNAKSYIAARYEYFGDPQGTELFSGFLSEFCDAPCRAPGGHVGEGTLTYAYNITPELQVRAEVRDDYASQPIFEKGDDRLVQTQPVAELGFIYSFTTAGH